MSDPFKNNCYKKNYVKEVIIRVDLLSPLPNVNTALPPALNELAVKYFSIQEPRESVRRNVEISDKGVASSEARIKEWRFHGKERTKTLTIGEQCVFVQHTKYQTYELMKEEFVHILNGVADIFGRVQCSRVGLRYVNTIEPTGSNPMDWAEYLDPQLLSLFQFPPEADRIALSRVFHNIELAFDEFNLRYRFGMHNPDYPARIRQKVFVLDLDAHTESAMEISEVPLLLDSFHATIQRYFEQSITDNLRGLMNAD